MHTTTRTHKDKNVKEHTCIGSECKCLQIKKSAFIHKKNLDYPEIRVRQII